MGQNLYSIDRFIRREGSLTIKGEVIEMKVSKKWAWGFLVLISVLFIFFLSLILVQSTAEGAGEEMLVDINIIHDSYAITQTYDTFFMVFSEELLRFVKENRGKISGQHRVFVLEFYRIFDPADRMIFIYLDLNKDLKEPLLVHRERVCNLNNQESIKEFADKAIKNLVRIIGKKGPKKHEI